MRGGDPTSFVQDIYVGFLVIFAITLVAFVWGAVELWRKPAVAERMTDSILQMRLSQGNERIARALTRAFLPGVLMMGFMVVITGSGFLGQEHRLAVTTVGLTGVAFSLLLMGSVAVFNQPKFLAPPHMRADRSLFAREE